MREILFRGQILTSKKWVEGHLIYFKSFPCIRYLDSAGFYHEEYVIPETVGQYTGLTDKNGKKIFEGDIVINSCGRKETVEFYKGRYYPFIAFPEYNCWDEKECKIIGNLHDNPELIGGEPE